MDISGIEQSAKAIIDHPALSGIEIDAVARVRANFVCKPEEIDRVRRDIYAMELELADKYPGVKFDFSTKWVGEGVL